MLAPPPRANALERAPARGTPGAGEPGPLLFARFAFRPNELGYCGGDDARSLFEHVREGVVDGDVLRLDREFEGAWPYLQLIAASNGIADPLAREVVEAYWLGNRLLERVPPGSFIENLEMRFRGRSDRNEWKWLRGHPGLGARAHHSFHVLSVLPRTGLLRGGHVADVLGAMQNCTIRPAQVAAVDGGDLIVRARPFELIDGRLVIGDPRVELARRWLEEPESPVAAGDEARGSPMRGAGFVDDVVPGEWVALHWGWACSILEPRQRVRLEAVTAANLRIAAEAL